MGAWAKTCPRLDEGGPAGPDPPSEQKNSRRVSPFSLPNRLKPRRAETEICDGSFALSLGHCRGRWLAALRRHRRHVFAAASAAADHAGYRLVGCTRNLFEDGL